MTNNHTSRSHSIAGIISFILGSINAIANFSNLVYAGYLGTQNPAILNDDNSLALMTIGFIVILGFLFGLIGIGFGVFGTFAPKRQKLFPIIGIIINTAVIVILASILAVGLSLQ
ncbi:MAG: hypothetical protein ACFBSE_06605 [Prochloraceae cyanobacterium]